MEATLYELGYRDIYVAQIKTEIPEPADERAGAPAAGPCGGIDNFGVCIATVVY